MGLFGEEIKPDEQRGSVNWDAINISLHIKVALFGKNFGLVSWVTM